MSSVTNLSKSVLTFAAMLIIGYGIGEGIRYTKHKINEPAPLQAFETIDSSKHFAQTDKKVIVYATAWCPHCKKAKQFLNDNNIAYDLRDIEYGSESHKALYDSLEKPGIPQIIIGDKVFSGFNQALIAQELSGRGLI